MTAPTITWGTVKNGTSGTSQAANMPASIAAGDLLLLFCAYDSTTAPTTPGGWTLINGGANTSELYIFGKIAAGSDTVTVAGPGQDYVMLCGKVPAAEHNVTTISTDITIGTAATGTSTTANPPSATAGSAADYLAIAACVIDMNATTNTLTAQPSGYTTATLTKSASSTTSCALGVATKALSASSTENPGGFTNTSRPWRAQTLLIPPVVAAGGGGLSLTDHGDWKRVAFVDNFLTTGSFTPDANSILVLLIEQWTPDSTTANFTVSSTHTGMEGSWTQVVTSTSIFASVQCDRVSIWYCRVGASPSAGTVTVTADFGGGSYYNHCISAVSITGYNKSYPFLHTASNTSTSSTSSLEITPSRTFMTGGIILGAIQNIGAGSITDPSSPTWTVIHNGSNNDGDWISHGYSTAGEGITTFSWTGLSTDPKNCVAVEVVPDTYIIPEPTRPIVVMREDFRRPNASAWPDQWTKSGSLSTDIDSGYGRIVTGTTATTFTGYRNTTALSVSRYTLRCTLKWPNITGSGFRYFIHTCGNSTLSTSAPGLISSYEFQIEYFSGVGYPVAQFYEIDSGGNRSATIGSAQVYGGAGLAAGNDIHVKLEVDALHNSRIRATVWTSNVDEVGADKWIITPVNKYQGAYFALGAYTQDTTSENLGFHNVKIIGGGPGTTATDRIYYLG